MIQFLSFAFFGTVLMLSIAAIVATAKAELPFILKALGIAPQPLPPLRPEGERRVRVIRQAQIRPESIRMHIRAAA